jgi:hypothetical protein
MKAFAKNANGQRMNFKACAIAFFMGILSGSRNKTVGGLKSVSKYRSRKTTVDGVTYDSAKEARRGAELRLLERAGAISDLRTQEKFVLIPPQKRNGKVVERPVTYIADFVYTENGQTVVEDVKTPATRTPQYVIKRKLLLWEFGLQVREV